MELVKQNPISLKIFQFEDSSEDCKIEIQVPEIVNPQYGMYVWPAAPVLAQYLWHHRRQLPGKRLLELGAGTALPGVLAAKLGAEVTLTDGSHLPKCLENSVKTCRSNDIDSIIVCGLTWGQFSPQLARMQPDIVIASDCFYDTEDFENVLVTVSYLLEKGANTEFWTTYQLRSMNWTIESLLNKWKLKAREVPLKTFGASSHALCGSDLPGRHTIQMFVITRDTS